MSVVDQERQDTSLDPDTFDLAPDAGWNAHYIDGEWVGADGDTLDIVNPSIQSAIGQVPAGSEEDVDAAFDAATVAQERWADRPPQARVTILDTVQHRIDEYEEELTTLFAVECGGPRNKAEIESELAQSQLQVAQGLAFQASGSQKESAIEGKENLIERDPVGTVGAITPWNFPFHLSMRLVAPALALGNTVVLKPASNSALMGGLVIARLFEEAGVPDGVLNIVTGSGSEVGSAIASHEDADFFSFTGSSEVGREVGKQAIENFVFPALELGGNNAHLVMESADLERAIDAGEFGSFTHQGQECISINRHLVHERHYDDYVDRLAERATQLPIGDPQHPDTIVGPVIDETQRDTMLELIDESVDAGATIEAGGDHDGLFVEPTVLADVTNDMPIASNEHFGPIAPVISFSDTEEAIDLANDTEYGLSGSVHASDIEKAKRIARALETGMVHINDQPLNDEAHVAFGGKKASGIGRFNGEWIMRELTETKWISVQHEARPYPMQ